MDRSELNHRLDLGCFLGTDQEVAAAVDVIRFAREWAEPRGADLRVWALQEVYLGETRPRASFHPRGVAVPRLWSSPYFQDPHSGTTAE